MRQPLRRIGAYVLADSRGLLPQRGPDAGVDEPWARAVRALVERYVGAWGSALHSVYVRGSVARNLAVPGLSDLDSFGVLRSGAEIEAAEFGAWAAILDRELIVGFPFVVGVEADLVPLEAVLDRKNFYAFVVKCEAACVHGSNLSELLEPFHLREVDFQTRHFQAHLDEFLTEFPLEPEVGRPGFVAWLAKRFLRLGMELVRQVEGRYTRDLYLCYESFASHHPRQADSMYRALELAINPVADDETVRFVRDFGNWLAAQARTSNFANG